MSSSGFKVCLTCTSVLADTFFCVVDLHAITMPHDPKALRAASHATAAAYLAAGVDSIKSSIFMQSHVSGHSELTWLLGCYTPIGWLERMIQYKVRVELPPSTERRCRLRVCGSRATQVCVNGCACTHA